MDLSQFGASGAVVVVVLLFLKFMRNEGDKRDATYEKVAQALDGVTKSNIGLQSLTKLNTTATKSADEYLRQRNGRDNEFHTEVMMSLKDIPVQAKIQADQVASELKRVGDMTASQLKLVGEQTIKEQVVEHQHVQKSDVGSN